MKQFKLEVSIEYLLFIHFKQTTVVGMRHIIKTFNYVSDYYYCFLVCDLMCFTYSSSEPAAREEISKLTCM